MQPVNAQIDRRAFSHLDDLLLDLFLHLGHHLLDAGRMDTAVGDELVQRQPRNLAADGIETAQNDRLGRIIDDDLDTSRSFQSPNVAPLTADDAAFDLVALDIEYRYGILYRRLGRHTLDRRHDDPFGLLRRRKFRLVDVGGRFRLRFGLHVLDEYVLRIFRTHARNLLQPCILLLHQAIDLFVPVFEQLPLRLQLFAQPFGLPQPALQFPLLALQPRFDLLGPLFALSQTLVPLIDLTVIIALQLDELLLRLKDSLFLYHFAFGNRLLQCGFTLRADRILGNVARYQNIDPDTHNGRYDARYYNSNHDSSVLVNLYLNLINNRAHKKPAQDSLLSFDESADQSNVGASGSQSSNGTPKDAPRRVKA